MLKIAISGASGFIGRHLIDYFTELGHEPIALGRPLFRDEFFGELVKTIEHCDVVINLAGSPINKRWTDDYMKEIMDSRIHVTHQIVNAIKGANQKPKLFISISAVGYYPNQGDFDEYTEQKGEGFLADLCYAWEQEARQCPSDVRLVITRLGIVLSPDGGALQQMMKPIKQVKMATVVGKGSQPFPWIDVRDVCRAMEFIINHPELQGVVNLVAPDSVSQYLFTRIMAKYSGAWFTIHVPSSLFNILYGKGASFLTTGQHVFPSRIMEAGFDFIAPTLKSFFKLNK